MKVKIRIFYTDGEIVDRGFETLKECLNYLNKEIVEKNEFADRIMINID